jgi:hypothetical protein
MKGLAAGMEGARKPATVCSRSSEWSSHLRSSEYQWGRGWVAPGLNKDRQKQRAKLEVQAQAGKENQGWLVEVLVGRRGEKQGLAESFEGGNI